jgi:hypothetical protein
VCDANVVKDIFGRGIVLQMGVMTAKAVRLRHRSFENSIGMNEHIQTQGDFWTWHLHFALFSCAET